MNVEAPGQRRVGAPRTPGAARVALPAGPWITVLDALAARFPSVPHATWAARCARGEVLDAGGAPIAADAPHVAGRVLHYHREVAVEPEVPDDVTVLHVDARLVVACKPHFLPVAPTGPWVRRTLVGRLATLLGRDDVVPLHRIDRATAGLVLLSVDPATRARYQALFRERRLLKRYEALAPPLPALEFPRVRRSRLERGEPFFRVREATGEPNAETRIDVDERGAAFWRYRLEPVTGRKHQLRVHMAALGAPLLGDPWYPELQPHAADDLGRPLALLARELAFEDPVDGEPRRWVSARTLRPPG